MKTKPKNHSDFKRTILKSVNKYVKKTVKASNAEKITSKKPVWSEKSYHKQLS